MKMQSPAQRVSQWHLYPRSGHIHRSAGGDGTPTGPLVSYFKISSVLHKAEKLKLCYNYSMPPQDVLYEQACNAIRIDFWLSVCGSSLARSPSGISIHCHPQPTIRTQVQEGAMEVAMLSCQYCGAASPDNSRFCHQCGRSLNIPSPTIANGKSSRSVYVRWAILIAALTIIVAGTVKTLPLIASGSSPTRTTPNFSPFVGTWSGHGRLLNFALNGRAQYTARAYLWCAQGVPLPCDSMQGNEIIDGINEQLEFTRTSGSTAYGTITFSTAGDTGQQVTVSLLPKDTIALYFGNTTYSILCGAQAPGGFCGA